MENANIVLQIKQQYPLMRLVRENVLNLKRTRPNGWWIGRCPFHQTDSDPRSKRKFWIDARPGREICSCFVPLCAASNPASRPMDVINFYARLHNLDNRQAIFELAELLGLLEVDHA